MLKKDIRMRDRKKNEYNPPVLKKNMRTREGVGNLKQAESLS